jgi:general nucleoside transport system permease protein
MPIKSPENPPGSQKIDLEHLDLLVRQYGRIISVLAPITAVVAALLLIGVLIFSLGKSPLEAYKALFVGAFGTLYDTATSLTRATPLILVGLGAAFAIRGSVFNIGGEGQIAIGGLAATIVGIYLKGLPAYIHLPLALLAGFIGGGIWGAIPGYFYAKRGTNLIITTIMMNEIALGIIQMMVKGPIQEPPGNYPQSAQVLPTAVLPNILHGTVLHAGFILAIVIAIVLYIILFHTPLGYEVRAVGENAVGARHAGINIFGTRVLLMVIAGGLAGLAGASEILGSQLRLRPAFLPNYGYEALAVAMLGQTNPLGVFISGILFGALKAGAGSMQRATNLPMNLITVVSGGIILFVVIAKIMNKLPRYLAKKSTTDGTGGSLKRLPGWLSPKETPHA